MLNQEAVQEYALALKKGQKEYRERIAAEKEPYPAVLDEIRTNFDLSILMITHDFSMLDRYADQVVLIDHTIKLKGKPAQVLNSEAFRTAFHLKGGNV